MDKTRETENHKHIKRKFSTKVKDGCFLLHSTLISHMTQTYLVFACYCEINVKKSETILSRNDFKRKCQFTYKKRCAYGRISR